MQLCERFLLFIESKQKHETAYQHPPKSLNALFTTPIYPTVSEAIQYVNLDQENINYCIIPLPSPYLLPLQHQQTPFQVHSLNPHTCEGLHDRDISSNLALACRLQADTACPTQLGEGGWSWGWWAVGGRREGIFLQLLVNLPL